MTPPPAEGRAPVDNPEVRFERNDVDPGTVAKWVVALGGVSVVVGAISIWLLVALRHREERSDPDRPALYFRDEKRQPEGVRLQSAPFQDLAVLREQEAKFLNEYGWVDRASGTVHIPIQEAMRLYVERQARAAAAAANAASAPLAQGVPTDSAPVPSPMAVTATPMPPPPASPAPSEKPAPPAPHGPGPTGARQ